MAPSITTVVAVALTFSMSSGLILEDPFLTFSNQQPNNPLIRMPDYIFHFLLVSCHVIGLTLFGLAIPQSTTPKSTKKLTKGILAVVEFAVLLVGAPLTIYRGSFSYDSGFDIVGHAAHTTSVNTIRPERFMTIFIGIMAIIILISFKIYFNPTWQTSGIVQTFITLCISTFSLLLIDQVLSFCNKNCNNPFRQVPVHLLSLVMNIFLTALLLPLHMSRLAPARIVLIENMVKTIMSMSFAVVVAGYFMVIMLWVGII